MSEFVSSSTRELFLSTIIFDVKKMRKLKITFEQYAICYLVEEFIAKHSSMNRDEFSAMGDIYNIKDIKDKGRKLRDLKLLSIYKGEKEVFVTVTEKWGGLRADHEILFHKLWEDYGRVGYYGRCKKAFVDFLKSGETWENLWTVYWPSYKKYLKSNNTHQMHLSTFLDLKDEKFKSNYKSNAHYDKANKGMDIPVKKSLKIDPKDARG